MNACYGTKWSYQKHSKCKFFQVDNTVLIAESEGVFPHIVYRITMESQEKGPDFNIEIQNVWL